MPSHIKVFVRWNEPSVFAGEDVKCTITFKNVSKPEEVVTQDISTWSDKRQSSTDAASGQIVMSGTRRSPSMIVKSTGQPTLGNQQQYRHHRATGSLSIPPTPIVSPRSSTLSVGNNSNVSSPRQHQRTVSIVSLGSSEGGKSGAQSHRMIPPSRPGSRHNRSASLQFLPRREEKQTGGRYSVSFGSYSSQKAQAPILPKDESLLRLNVPQASARRCTRHSSYSTSPNPSQSGSRRSSPLSNESFKFPAEPSETVTSKDDQAPPRKIRSEGRSTTKKPSIVNNTANLRDRFEVPLASRVLSGVSVDESARDSGEFYAMSDKSTDTFASEQMPVHAQRFPNGQAQNGRFRTHKSKPEKLLMGYAQVGATFTVDGSLVDQAQFEEVKRKGFLGGQGGGGVVGVETPRVGGGVFGGFSLSSLGESIGGLLSGGEMSSTKEMRGVTASRAIPLLSTPQSLLFVDLQLSPGEEKSFELAYPIPRGLPASYKGKAIKITYNLTIGTQWSPNQEKLQQVRQVNVPFRVFSGVNVDGHVLGHDLMQPYVILQDKARKRSIDSGLEQGNVSGKSHHRDSPDFDARFTTYASSMLDPKSRRQSSTGMDDPARLTPTTGTGSRVACKEAINSAILRSNQTSLPSDKSQNRFDIARNGIRVGAVILNRPLHRLGETIFAVVDLSRGEIPIFSVRCVLETVEKVDPSIALRSETSITRVTRRIYAASSENALFAKSLVFSPSIPVAASPSLLTSAIELEWRLRFEFATTRAGHEEDFASGAELLEEVGRDERGLSLAAVETMLSETFEIAIPLTVFGDAVKDSGEEEESLGFSI